MEKMKWYNLQSIKQLSIPYPCIVLADIFRLHLINLVSSEL